MEPAHRQSDGTGVLRVKGIDQQVLAPRKKACRTHDGDDGRLPDVRSRDAENVAEQDMVEVYVGLDGHVHDQACREHAGEDDAHHRVLLQPRVAVEVAGGKRTCHAGGKCTRSQRHTNDVGHHYARQDGVAHSVPHQ